ncbi:MAG: Ribonuclease 3 [Thermotoga sp. 50_1627]|uniref:ribonuclease III n=1 Tax=Pseudothermotoga sp. TaxID=2033661 RepID=UPI00076D28CD|nr:MAG: Ribonuclease 3 [Thermotoga sp. 50_64]KUK25462.1 MAG: Ribonuclease 3 [Thermotoga sp. 50_1627]MBC7115737.1 ribonuclease III [Pseudothermotoga sp.]HBT38999.1 ribonuclease III [Pseudothermotoga sp.]HCO97719.1 ribonuclease III [Pseudothermotoga sp.]
MKEEEVERLIDFMTQLRYNFCDPQLLFTALCHSSYAHEEKQRGRKDIQSNERLEFLGDAIVDLLIAEYLFRNYPEAPEGTMSKIKAAAASEDALALIAKDIGLNRYIFLGHGEELNGGRERESILSGALEAFAAALYLDGGMKPLNEILVPHLVRYIKQIAAGRIVFDHKTALQEFAQEKYRTLPEYVLVREEGPAHMKRFFVEVRLRGQPLAIGEGPSIKDAEKNAAKLALERLKEMED